MNKKIHRITCTMLMCIMMLGSTINAQAAPEEMSGLSALGNVYYVSTAGNDANPGTASAPFKTFVKATSMLSAGSTLYILPGTYNEQLKISNSGMEGAWIIVRPSGGTVVIDLRNTSDSPLNLRGSYIDISNLEVKGSTGICINSSGNYLKISSLVVHDCQTHGIFISGQHVEVVGNAVYATSLVNQARSTSSGWASGIKIGLGGNDVLVSDNKSYYNYGEGIAVTRGSNVMIRGNTVYDNYSVNIYVDNSFDTRVEQNFVTCHTNTGFERNGNPAAGIALGEEFYDGWGAQLNRVTITNNIVAFCRRGIYYFGGDPSLMGTGLKNSTIAYNTLWSSTDTALGVIYGNGQAGSLITSNIIWQANNKLAYVENSAGLTLKNNLWKTAPPSNVRGTGDRIGEPLFLVAPSYDPQTFVLSALSPAIGGALNIGISTDYFGNLRGPSYEIGAAQYLNTIPSPTPTITMNASTPTAVWTPTQATLATSTSVPALTATNTVTSTAVPHTPTSTSIQSTPTSVIPGIVPSETVFNDNHAAFTYSGNWQSVSRAKAYGGSFKLTRQVGAYVTLRFTGQSFSLLYTSGPSNGKFDVYLDNQLVATLDQKTSETLFQKRWDYSGRFPVGPHELRFVFTGPTDARGTIDAVIVR